VGYLAGPISGVNIHYRQPRAGPLFRLVDDPAEADASQIAVSVDLAVWALRRDDKPAK
jgi:hypothetical protein